MAVGNERKVGQFFPFLLIITHIGSLASAGSIVAIFTKPSFAKNGDPNRLQHIVVHKDSGSVYVGGVNLLYQLSSELDLQVIVETGPEEDSCPYVDCSDIISKTLTDNVNKALVIDYENERLIACGTLYQGKCTLRSLKNISNELMEVEEPVVSNTLTATTVAFIAPGPPNQTSTNVLYVAQTYMGSNSPDRSISSVSTRSLTDLKNSPLTINGKQTWINYLNCDRYPIHYVFGGSSEGFSYFSTTQMRKRANNSPFISKLVRQCQDHPGNYSYVEIPFECVAKNGIRYNLVQAAYLDKAGSDLATELNITEQDDVLYAVFAQSDDGTSNRPTSRSALCVYSLKSIRETFMQNIQKCFDGEGHRGFPFESSSRPCVHAKLETTGGKFCGNDVNMPLVGNKPVTEHPVYIWKNVLVTAVTASVVGDDTVVFVGTSRGHLKKMAISKNVRKNNGTLGAFEYGDITVDEGSRVSSNLDFDPQRMHLYPMTEHKVTKVRVQDCGMYKTCGECLVADDPYCGWCSLENQCSLRSDCQDVAKDPLHWIPYKRGRCPVVASITPNEIQRTTTRMVSLVIDNLPDLSDQLQCAFSAFGKTLLTNATRTANGVSCSTPRPDDIPANGQDFFTTKLSIRTTTGPDFVATNFTFFDCREMASTCHLCLVQADKYQCGWCQMSDKCEVREQCERSGIGDGRSYSGGPWLGRYQICPRHPELSYDQSQLPTSPPKTETAFIVIFLVLLVIIAMFAAAYFRQPP